MSCPNCGEKMTALNYDNQNILHCSNCGASFFEENGINRITVDSARKIAEDQQNNLILGQQKLCPKDKTILTAIKNEETVPNDVTLLRCSACRGIFSYPEDLLKFKKAQNVKIEFFRLWNKPLPSLQTVLVFSFLAITSLSLLINLSFIQKSQFTQTKADETAKKVQFYSSGRYLFVSFKTTLPLKSQLIFIKTATGEKITKVISKTAATVHYATLTDINPKDGYTYKLILIDDKGKQIETEEKKLNLPP